MAHDFSLSRRGLLLGGVSAGLGACAPGGGDATKIIKWAVVSSYVRDQIRLSGVDHVVQQQGWLRERLQERNLSLEWFPAPNAAVGPIINEAFASRQIQFAGYSDLPSIILNASGAARTKLLAPGNPGDSYLVVPANSSARSIEDLVGKRLAIHRGRPWELPLLRLLESKGLSYDDFELYNINPDAGAAAIASGGVDGLYTVSAFALEERGVARIIWSTAQAPVEWKNWGGFWASQAYIDEAPDIVQLVVTAYVRASHWISLDENKEAIIQLGTLNGTPERIVRRNYDESNISWKERWSPLTPPAVVEHYRRDIAFAQQHGIIQNPFDASELFDESYVRHALTELGLENYWVDERAQPPAEVQAGERT